MPDVIHEPIAYVEPERIESPNDVELDLKKRGFPQAAIDRRATILNSLNSNVKVHPHFYGGYPQPWDESLFKVRLGYEHRMFVRKNDAGVWVDVWIGSKKESVKYCTGNGDLRHGGGSSRN